ncbi:MAG: FAD-dependent oxidoreductase [Nocardioidaceae bacterium]|nr:MAG: FAD-dependent oxidoreductase [Nocardioidaceae bacterium]
MKHTPAGKPAHAEFVVIGAGLAGAATAWQLATAGHDVAILERGVPADRAGSSHGSARIFRYGYANRTYAEMVREARNWWDELERTAGQTLITPSGAVDFGELRELDTLARVLDAIEIDHEVLDAGQAQERFPGIQFDGPVLWHAAAGVIDSEVAVSAMVRLAVASGARILTHWPVDSVQQRSTGYLVHGPRGSFSASNVIVAAGGWLPSLLPKLDLPARVVGAFPKLTVTQEQAFHFPYQNPSDVWPALIEKSHMMRSYGLPGGRDSGYRGLKLAEQFGGKPIGSGERQDGIVDPVKRDRLVEYVKRRLPGLIPEPYAGSTCLFTMTPTEDFILDRHDRMTVLSPCSSHGAKFAPLIGHLAANAATASTASVARESIPVEFLVMPVGA